MVIISDGGGMEGRKGGGECGRWEGRRGAGGVLGTQETLPSPAHSEIHSQPPFEGCRGRKAGRAEPETGPGDTQGLLGAARG